MKPEEGLLAPPTKIETTLPKEKTLEQRQTEALETIAAELQGVGAFLTVLPELVVLHAMLTFRGTNVTAETNARTAFEYGAAFFARMQEQHQIHHHEGHERD